MINKGYGYGLENRHTDYHKYGYGCGQYWEYGTPDGDSRNGNVWQSTKGCGLASEYLFQGIVAPQEFPHYLIR